MKRKSSAGVLACILLVSCGVLIFQSPQAMAAPASTGHADNPSNRAAVLGVQEARSTLENFSNRAADNRFAESVEPILDLGVGEAGGSVISGASAADTVVSISRIEIVEPIPDMDPDFLAEVTAEYEGRTLPVSELFGLSTRLTRVIRSHGYALSQIVLPPQEIIDGVVRFRVIRGHISSIAVEGVPRGIYRAVLATLETLKDEPAVTLAQLERALLLVREMYGVSASSVLRPDPDGEVGGVSLIVKSGFDFSDSFVVAHNIAANHYNTGRLGVGSFVSLPWGYSGRFGVQVNGDEKFEAFRVGVLTYSQLFSDGLRWDIAYSVTSNKVDDANILPIEGRTEFINLSLSYPVLKSRRNSYRLSMGYNISNHQTDTIPAANANQTKQTLYNTKRRSLNFSLNGETFTRGSKFNSFTTMQYAIVLGDKRNGASEFSTAQDNQQLRPGAKPDFAKFQIDWSQFYHFDSGWVMRWTLKGQTTSDPLPSVEELSYGGDRFGRGYDGGEITGDRGVIFAGDLGYNFRQYTGYVFADHAWLTNLRTTEYPIDTKQRSQSRASSGIGARVQFGRSNRGLVDGYLAKPDSIVAARGNKDIRGFVRVSFSF